MLEIDAPGGVVAELERQTQINEDIIRYMTVKVDELEEGPTGDDAQAGARPRASWRP